MLDSTREITCVDTLKSSFSQGLQSAAFKPVVQDDSNEMENSTCHL